MEKNLEPTHFESLYPDTSYQEEISATLKYIQGGNSCQVIGLPGVGRSNMLKVLAYNKAVRLKHLGDNQKWMHFVLVQFSEVRRKSLLDVTKFLFLSLTESLRERQMMDEYRACTEIFKESLLLQDEMVLFQGLKRAVNLLAIEKELTIVFLFDRFEEYVPVLESDFFENLRVLRNHAKYRFSVVFSLNKALEELVEPVLFAEFHEFVAGNIVYMRLCDPVNLDFRLKYLEKITEKTIPKQPITQIKELTGGQGKLTYRAAEVVLSNNADVPQGKEKLAEWLLSFRVITGAVKEIWRSFSPVEQRWILDGCKLDAESEAIAQYFSRIGLVKDGVIQIPLLATFLSDTIGNSLVTEQITFDDATNTIHKGKLVLSDRLTASEFRLLQFLLHHPEEIVDREQVIQIVWSDAASTAGVTDQAVDQLIFRLRKKIEDNPNQPQHLHTIKGRGFKFTP